MYNCCGKIYVADIITFYAAEASGSKKKKLTEKEPPNLKEANFNELRKSIIQTTKDHSDDPDEALEKSFLIRRKFLNAKHKFQLKEYIEVVQLNLRSFPQVGEPISYH